MCVCVMCACVMFVVCSYGICLASPAIVGPPSTAVLRARAQGGSCNPPNIPASLSPLSSPPNKQAHNQAKIPATNHAGDVGAQHSL